jgi:hypothetical protein
MSRIGLLAAAALLTILCAQPAAGAPLALAYVQGGSATDGGTGGDHGNAWLFSRAGVCYALLPRHVLADPQLQRDDRYASLAIVRPGRTGLTAQADRCAVFKGADLTLMRVSGVESLGECGAPLLGLPGIDAVLAREPALMLAMSDEHGQVQNIPLLLRAIAAPARDPGARGAEETDFFWVIPRDAGFKLTGGMSGGLVLDGEDVLGMLISVPTAEARSARDGAQVLRIDRASLLLTRYFQSPASVAEVDQPGCNERTPASPAASPAATAGTATRPGNRAAASCGAQTQEWSAPPLSAAYRPENLVGAGGELGLWRAASAEDVTVDVHLCGTRPVSEVVIDSSRCDTSDNRGASVEVLRRAGPQAGYTSLGYTAMDGPGRHVVDAGGDPRLASDLRLRFVVAAQTTVCSGPLEVR